MNSYLGVDISPLPGKKDIMSLPGNCLGSIGVILVCLDICKGQHTLILQWQLTNEQDSITIHTFYMNEQSSVLADIYWIQGTRA